MAGGLRPTGLHGIYFIITERSRPRRALSWTETTSARRASLRALMGRSKSLLYFAVPVAQEIQLDIEYAPDPPFHSGTPETAPPEVVQAFFARYGNVKESREAEARRFATKLGTTE